MDRQFYLGLAASGRPLPIATHLVLHEHADHEEIVADGGRLGFVIEQAARRFGSPLGLPLMDLAVEKESLLLARGVPATEIDAYHFERVPEGDSGFLLTRKMAAACGAIRRVSSETDLVPVGMCIGPFSLMTKLVLDPITPGIYGRGGCERRGRARDRRDRTAARDLIDDHH